MFAYGVRTGLPARSWEFSNSGILASRLGELPSRHSKPNDVSKLSTSVGSLFASKVQYTTLERANGVVSKEVPMARQLSYLLV
jgi:hypothetical protein